MAVPLILSAFTHLWNPIGFPSIAHDESTYLRRALQVLHGLGPQEPITNSDHPYDHPYFGQILLAAVLGIIGYPGSLHPSVANSADAINSIQMLFTVPRLLMGILAVVDTFLIYKIADWRYNRKVAFIASILFAVMPLTWFTRRIYLDTIQLPFILSSILFAVYCTKRNRSLSTDSDEKPLKSSRKRNIPIILLSGIFLGLAIFTKIPAITIIPLVAYLIGFRVNNSRRSIGSIIRERKTNLKALGLWFIPVILIPAIWPLYSLSAGQFDRWRTDVLWQADREGAGLQSLQTIYSLDPVLVILGLAGLIFAAFKKDFLVLLWLIPFLIYIHISGWVLIFHWTLLIPGFCISAAAMIEWISTRIKKKNKVIEETVPQSYSEERKTSLQANDLDSTVSKHFLRSNWLEIGVVAGVVIFGLVCTVILITMNLNSSLFQLYAFIAEYIPSYKVGDNDINSNSKITMIADKGMRDIGWIPKYVLNKDHDFRTNFRSRPVNLEEPLKTKKVLLIVDSRLMHDIPSTKTSEEHTGRLPTLYKNTKTIKIFEENRPHYDETTYPYNSNQHENRGIGKIEVRANY
jgi:4-amino-4-deoxy-L-arabinose transferase-like glycosyltransferase